MPWRLASTLAVGLLAVGLTACDPQTGGPGDGPGGPSVGPGGSYPNVPYTELTPTEQAEYDRVMAELIGTGEEPFGLINRFWTSNWPSIRIGQLYAQPTGATPYEGGSIQSGCGPLTPENAWYCSEDRGIYYDDNLFRALYRAYGAGAPGLLLAHEWGHHIQSQIGQPTVSIRAELQADCLAGMFYGHGYESGVIDSGDLVGVGAGAIFFGDRNYRASEWFAPNVHGPAAWRGKAFVDGALGEFAYCTDYEHWEDRGTEALGSYRWLPAPAIAIERRDGGVLVATLRERTAFLSEVAAPAPGTTAAAAMPQAFQSWFAGRAQPLGSVVEIFTGSGTGGSLGGTGAVQGYTYTDAAGQVQHGILFLHVATSGQAAGASVLAAGQPPSTNVADPVWNPLVNYLSVVAFSLCPPDGAGAFCRDLGQP